MSTIRLIAIAALLVFASALPSHSQQKHWLIGSWKGALGGLSSSNKYGSDRILTVKSVTPDGTAAGVWEGQAGKVAVKLTVSGENVTFSTPGSQGATYQLTHKGNTLEGSWQGSGSAKGGSISLTKQ
jgi:hypothetical protein